MFRTTYLFLSIAALLLISCTPQTRQVPEPNFNPYLLKPGKYVSSKGRPVNMDSLPKPTYTPVKSTYVNSGEWPYQPVAKYEWTDIEFTYQPAKLRKADMHSFTKPRYVETQPKKVPSRWPRWTPVDHLDRQFPFTYLSLEHGLKGADNRAFLEDRHGNIWIADIDEGVSVWDGAGLFHFTQREGLSGRTVYRLLEDREGNIWIGTLDGGVSIWNGVEFMHLTEKEGLNNDEVSSLLKDDKGNIWIGTFGGGVNIWDGNGLTQWTADAGLSHDNVWDILQDKQGKIWIATVDGISIWDESGFSYLTSVEGLPDNNIWRLLQDREGKIWIGCRTNGEISIWDGQRLRQFTGIPLNLTSSLLQDRKENIWIRTQGSGVFVWDGTGFTNYREEQGLPKNVGFALFEDSGGRIWIGNHDNGISVWNDNRLAHYTREDGLNGSTAHRLFDDSEGNIWISTFGGGVNIWDGSGFASSKTTEGLIHNHVREFLKDRKGRIWIATREGISIWDGKGFRNYPETYRSSAYWHRSLLENDDGKIWIGYDSGLRIWDEDGFYEYTREHGLTSNYITCLLKDQKGNIWMGTDKGITYWNGVQFIHFTETEGLVSNEVHCLLEDRNGRIWIGARGGLSIWNGQGFRNYAQNDGLQGNIISSLLEDTTGDIWLGTKNGLIRLVIEDDGTTITTQGFDDQDGLSHLQVNDLLLDQENQLWIGTQKNLNRLDLKAVQPDTTPPKLTLRDIQPFYDRFDWRAVRDSLRTGVKLATGKAQYALAKVRYDSVKSFTNLPLNASFPYAINQISLRWSGIHHATQQKLRYTYLLEGQENSWSPLVKENRITYHDLQPGRYTFKVRAVSGAGRWSETASYSFRIRPPWWQTGLAYAIYLLALVCFIWGFIRWRLHYIRLNYEREAALAAEAAAKEARQIAEAANEAKSTFLSTVSHELRTPLTSIIGFSKLNRKSLRNRIMPGIREEDHKAQKAAEKLDMNLDVVTSEGQRLTNLINELLDLAKIEAGKVEWRMTKVHPGNLIERATASTAALFEQKPEVKLITGLPEDLPVFTADRDRLLQVLINLISNAVKFTDHGQVNLEVRKEDQTLIFSVKDTGSGISPKNQKLVFEKFKQVEDQQTGRPKGTGLGLPICKEIVEHHGGRLWVESPIPDSGGTGSMFIFTVPLTKPT